MQGRSPQRPSPRKGLRSCAHRSRTADRFKLRIALAVDLLLLIWLLDVDAALEEGAVFDADALRDHVAGERAFVADVDAVAGVQIATHFADDHDLARHHVRGDNAVASDGHAVSGQVDGAFHAAVDVERFRPGDFTLDDERFADSGLLVAVHDGVAGGGNRRRLRGQGAAGVHGRAAHRRALFGFRIGLAAGSASGGVGAGGSAGAGCCRVRVLPHFGSVLSLGESGSRSRFLGKLRRLAQVLLGGVRPDTSIFKAKSLLQFAKTRVAVWRALAACRIFAKAKMTTARRCKYSYRSGISYIGRRP